MYSPSVSEAFFFLDFFLGSEDCALFAFFAKLENISLNKKGESNRTRKITTKKNNKNFKSTPKEFVYQSNVTISF